MHYFLQKFKIIEANNDDDDADYWYDDKNTINFDFNFDNPPVQWYQQFIYCFIY